MSAENNKRISDACAAFQEKLPELLGENRDPTTDPHLQECANCRELVNDLMYIAQQAKLLLPLHDPSPEVWNKIEAGIQKSPKA
jgi:predicted anti-sigma-YlaC factor YlaD